MFSFPVRFKVFSDPYIYQNTLFSRSIRPCGSCILKQIKSWLSLSKPQMPSLQTKLIFMKMCFRLFEINHRAELGFTLMRNRNNNKSCPVFYIYLKNISQKIVQQACMYNELCVGKQGAVWDCMDAARDWHIRSNCLFMSTEGKARRSTFSTLHYHVIYWVGEERKFLLYGIGLIIIILFIF